MHIKKRDNSVLKIEDFRSGIRDRCKSSTKYSCQKE